MKAKLDELGIDYRTVWESGPGEEIRERVEAVKRWFVHDWQALDNKVKSSIVEGVSVFLAMFDMPDVAKVFCPKAPKETDDPQAIEAQAQILRIKKAKEAAEARRRRRREGGGQSARPGARQEAGRRRGSETTATDHPFGQRRNAQGRGAPTADL